MTREVFSLLAQISLLSKISKMDTAGTFVKKNQPGKAGSFVTLTGWAALLSIASLVLVLVAGAYYGYKKATGQDQPYTLVIKGGECQR